MSIKVVDFFIENNLKRNHEKLRAILDKWQENDYQHLRFINLYEKSVTVINEILLKDLNEIRSIKSSKS